MQGVFTLLNFPDGRLQDGQVDPALFRNEGENENSASIRGVFAATEAWDLEVSYRLYQARIPDTAVDYFRQVGGVGVSLRF
jgi:hypothetical protein